MDIKRKKVLVVDDELEMQVFLSTLLETGGYKPIIAGGISDGLQKARKDKPALIILDVMISNEGGVQMYRNLKNDPKLAHVPVIVISTITRKAYLYFQKLQSTLLGASVSEPEAFLKKPPEAEELLYMIRNLTESVEAI